MEEEIEKIKKKKNNIKIIIFVIGALLIGLGSGFLLSKSFVNKESDKKTGNSENVDNKKPGDNNQNDNTKDNETDVFKTVSKYEANAIMKQFNGIKISSERLFSKDRFTIDEINVDEMLITALRQIDIYNACSKDGEKNVSLYFINNQLSNYVKKSLTLNDIKSKVKNGIHVGNPYKFDYSVKVNNEKNIEVVDLYCGDTFSAEDFVERKIVDAERQNDYVYVYEKVAFARYNDESLKSSDGNYKVDFYDNYKKDGNIIETLPRDDEVVSWDLYKTYKYTFKLIDEEYFFQSLELV